ncbi:MAG: hypothetical protein PHE55_00845 [Methylococcaceae bacterium]|nr:hypothetical protein [Methylococcaceae bacterium]
MTYERMNVQRDANWLRRTAGEISRFRKEETTFSKARVKALEDIRDKPQAAAGGAGMAPLAGIAAAIAGLYAAITATTPKPRDMLEDPATPQPPVKPAPSIAAMGIGAGLGGLAAGPAGAVAGAGIGAMVSRWLAGFHPDIKLQGFDGKPLDGKGDTIQRDTVRYDTKSAIRYDTPTAGDSETRPPRESSRGRPTARPARPVEATQPVSGTSAERKSALIAEMHQAGIKDPTEQAVFLSQMEHESSGFTHMRESFAYRSADRIMEVSKTARKAGRPAVEAAIDEGPEAVGNLMYDGRMGNTEPGDGFKYRGRGFTQLTGRANYEAAGRDLGIDLVGSPELAEEPATAARIATWYWRTRNLGAPARRGDVGEVTRRINGGSNGLADRQARFERYQRELANEPAPAGQPVGAPLEEPSQPVDRLLSSNAPPSPSTKAPGAQSSPDAPTTRKAPTRKTRKPPIVAREAQTVSTAVPTVSSPIIRRQPQAIEEAPPLFEPLGSRERQRSMNVEVQGANGNERPSGRFAHIATGGLSDPEIADGGSRISHTVY